MRQSKDMSQKNKVCILPTRGLIFAETIDGLLKNFKSEEIILIQNEKIPDCFNKGVELALKEKPKYIFFAEEDNEIPNVEDMITFLEDNNADILIGEYNCSSGSVIHRENDKIMFGGFGATLVKASIFDRLSKPYFETRFQYHIQAKQFIEVKNPDKKFGGHDVYFYNKCREQKLKIMAYGHYRHLRCDRLLRTETNKGSYNIKSL